MYYNIYLVFGGGYTTTRQWVGEYDNGDLTKLKNSLGIFPEETYKDTQLFLQLLLFLFRETRAYFAIFKKMENMDDFSAAMYKQCAQKYKNLLTAGLSPNATWRLECVTSHEDEDWW